MTFGDYEDLEIAVGNGVAVGANSIGLGSSTDARTLDDTYTSIEDLQFDVDSDAFVTKDSYVDTTFDFTQNTESPEDGLMQGTMKKKRSRTEFDRNSNLGGDNFQGATFDKLDKISSSIDIMVDLLKKKDMGKVPIWDAINEIPNLTEINRFKAMEIFETTSGTMDRVFLQMSREDRSKWIAHKLGGL